MKVLVTGGTGFVGQHLQEEVKLRVIPASLKDRRKFAEA